MWDRSPARTHRRRWHLNAIHLSTMSWTQTPPSALTPAVQRRPVAGARRPIPRRIHGVRLAITSTARSERRIAVRGPGVGVAASSASDDPARAPRRSTAKSCQLPGTPRSSTLPRSSKPVPEPTTGSRTVRETRMSPAKERQRSAGTRAQMSRAQMLSRGAVHRRVLTRRSGPSPFPEGVVSDQAGERVVEQEEVQCGDDDGDQEHQGTGQAAVDHVGHGLAGAGNQ